MSSSAGRNRLQLAARIPQVALSSQHQARLHSVVLNCGWTAHHSSLSPGPFIGVRSRRAATDGKEAIEGSLNGTARNRDSRSARPRPPLSYPLGTAASGAWRHQSPARRGTLSWPPAGYFDGSQEREDLGAGLTEKAVWHVLRQYAGKWVSRGSHLTTSKRVPVGCPHRCGRSCPRRSAHRRHRVVFQSGLPRAG